MKALFMVSFAVATVVEVGVAVLLLWQVVRSSRTAGDPPVLRGGDVLSAASLFGGSMVIVTLAAHGWSGLDGGNLMLFAATFGFATAALVERVRNRPAGGLLYVLPVLLGALAGLVGNTL
ncbi:hypothetical protein ACFC58_20915 [Kitasatospora purpeofusca]|uniref:hypothetical protein n=1 Tax=Kitasatospora purpeofusca TaxID=67352 RepID=UPI0035D8E464